MLLGPCCFWGPGGGRGGGGGKVCWELLGACDMDKDKLQLDSMYDAALDWVARREMRACL